jgi:hypothetical protein
MTGSGPEPKALTGGCHCGRVRFEVTLDLAAVVDCNCSICSKRGALWAFAQAPRFKLLQGADQLADYQFGRKNIHHLFCQACGIGSFSRGRAPTGEDTVAVNVCCLDGVDPATLKTRPFDGKSL